MSNMERWGETNLCQSSCKECMKAKQMCRGRCALQAQGWCVQHILAPEVNSHPWGWGDTNSHTLVNAGSIHCPAGIPNGGNCWHSVGIPPHSVFVHPRVKGWPRTRVLTRSVPVRGAGTAPSACASPDVAVSPCAPLWYVCV